MKNTRRLIDQDFIVREILHLLLIQNIKKILLRKNLIQVH
jgi:hypothetical protein